MDRVTSGSSKTIKCSVKKFVDFTCRRGNLESFGTAGPTAAEGQKAHKVLQDKKTNQEEAEVRVECKLLVNAKQNNSEQEHTKQLHLSGRIDLLDANPEAPCASEIKSCYAPPHRLPESTVSLHWAQLKVYGYCVLNKIRTEQATSKVPITLRLVWFNLIANEVITDEQKYTFEELETFVTEAAFHYVEWIALIDEQFSQTVATATTLEFPHKNFRSGQRDMAAAAYLCARDGFHVMCEAPTGIGKTVSALFPAVKAIGNGSIDRIIYLTAKNSGKQAAGSCLSQLQDHGLQLSAITITSKNTTCHCSNGTCERNPDDGSCPLTIGFFDKLPAARKQLIRSGIITPETIDNAAHEHALCPFELTLQMLPWVQVVICDFNYVFDPLVRLSNLTENTNRQMLLVDEAHNLTDRARSMYSAELSRVELKRAAADLPKNTLQGKNLQGLIRAIDRWAKDCPQQENAHIEYPKTISRAIKRCVQTMVNDTEDLVLSEAVAEAGKALFRYAVIEELYGNHHRCVTVTYSRGKFKNTTVTLQCLNATEQLKKSYKQYRCSVTFSATLRPRHFYHESLGLPDNTTAMSLVSPFDPSQQCTVVCDWVDTRYRAREQSVSPIVSIIEQVYRSRRGNYQVFFPSYVFMESVCDAFQRQYPDIPVIVQQRGTTERQRKEFLDHFTARDATLAFSILGGIFGEGVDYLGEQLVGSIIIGTGLSSISLTQKLIEEDYQSQGLNGFDYASRYPGFTRVLQTAGRVIRSENDKGVVVLVDQRFQQPFYKEHYPAHWNLEYCQNTEALAQRLHGFWRSP